MLMGEVLRIDDGSVTMLPDEAPQKVALMDPVVSLGPMSISPSMAWVGRIVDPYGVPLDGYPLPKGEADLSIYHDAPPAVSRKPLGAMPAQIALQVATTTHARGTVSGLTREPQAPSLRARAP